MSAQVLDFVQRPRTTLDHKRRAIEEQGCCPFCTLRNPGETRHPDGICKDARKHAADLLLLRFRAEYEAILADLLTYRRADGVVVPLRGDAS